MLMWSGPGLHVYPQKGVNTHKCILAYYQCVGQEALNPHELLRRRSYLLCYYPILERVLFYTSGFTFNLDSFLPPGRFSAAGG